MPKGRSVVFLALLATILLSNSLAQQTTNYVAKFSNSQGNVINSQVTDDGTNVKLNSSGSKLYFTTPLGNSPYFSGNHDSQLDVLGATGGTRWLNNAGTSANMVLLDNGNVGFGTGSPQAKLDVNGGGNFYGNLKFTAGNGQLQFNTPNGNLPYIGGTLDNLLDIRGATSGTRFLNNAGSAVNMIVLDNGNVGIGTTPPQYKLDVSGYIRTASGIVFPNGTVQTTASGGGTITGVTPGTGLSGGGTSGNVTLSIDGTVVRSTASNSFTAQQTFTSYPVLVNNTALFLDNENSSNYGLRSWVLSGISAEFWNKAWYDTSWGNGSIIAGYAGSGKTAMFHVDTRGTTYTYNGYVAGGFDYAELVQVGNIANAKYEPGDVLVIDKTTSSRFALSDQPYSRLVAGVYSTKPGVLASPHPMDANLADSEVPLALLGQAPCNVSTENGPINPGDLLVTSSTPGHAMRADDTAKPGTILGKALEPLAAGSGKIKILITLQ